MFYLAGLMLAIAAFAAWAQSRVNRGYALADQMCGYGSVACDNSKWLMLAAIMIALLALYRASMRQ